MRPRSRLKLDASRRAAAQQEQRLDDLEQRLAGRGARGWEAAHSPSASCGDASCNKRQTGSRGDIACATRLWPVGSNTHYAIAWRARNIASPSLIAL